MRDRDPGTAPYPGEFSGPGYGVPAQRPPSDPYVGQAVRRQLRPAAVVALVVLVATIAATGTVLIQSSHGQHRSSAAAAIVSAKAAPSTPYAKIVALMDGQAAALLRGNQKGWLAAVDPHATALRAEYAQTFRSLRSLDVSQFSYQVDYEAVDGDGKATIDVGVRFCFSMGACPDTIAPTIRQLLTFAPVDGRYVITAKQKSANPAWIQPLPWENGTLDFAYGDRVVVAGPPSQRKLLAKVAELGDRAAAVTDRVATIMGNPQQQYRIFVADDRTWKTWYGGANDAWTTGLEIPLNAAQGDVVLKMSALRDPAELARTVQHEMGHVVTIGGANQKGDFITSTNEWLTEGVAEYIEWSPKGATGSYRRRSVHAVMTSSNPPTTIAARPFGPKANSRTIDAFYGMGHFAVDCMARTYGQAKMYAFVRLRLRSGFDLENAAIEAYGVPFSTVDRTCLKWIKKTA